jgi:sortase A
MAMKKLIRSVGLGMLIAGLLVLSYPVIIWIYASAFQSYQDRLFQTFPTASASLTSLNRASNPKPEPHAVIGRLAVPSVSQSVMVVEGDQDRDLLVGAGHVPGTPLPGAPGNVAIAGHRDTFFRALRGVHSNDVIVLTTRNGSYSYVVESTEITDPSDVGVLAASAAERLTLITCYPFSFLGSAPERFIVRARRSRS